MNLLLVPQQEIDIAWEIALPILRRANTPGEEMDEKEVYRDLKDGLRQLWLGENQAFACLTEIRKTPHRKYVLIYMLAGERIKEWYVDFYMFLYSWARTQGAQSLEIQYPRPGWERLLSKLGFIKFDDTLIKEIV